MGATMSARELKSRILKLLKEDEEFRYAVAGLLGLEEILKRLDRHEAELVRLREDMNRGFELIERHISALGARWGLMAEDAFREGLTGIIYVPSFISCLIVSGVCSLFYRVVIVVLFWMVLLVAMVKSY